jgi:hypothetical protein
MQLVPDADILPGGTANLRLVQRIGHTVHRLLGPFSVAGAAVALIAFDLAAPACVAGTRRCWLLSGATSRRARRD